jgi:hypothetical protein
VLPASGASGQRTSITIMGMIQTTLRDRILSDIQPAIGHPIMPSIAITLMRKEARAREKPCTSRKKVGVHVRKEVKLKLKQPHRQLMSHRSRLASTC